MSVTKGVILQYFCKGQLPPKCVLQVMATRKINATSESKYRISLSDGVHRFSQAVLLADNEDQVPLDDSLIEIPGSSPQNSLRVVGEKLILVIGDFKVVSIGGSRIGNPIPVPQNAYQLPGPSTPETSGPKNQPPELNYKRPKSPGSPTLEENKAKQARRNLFPSKTTHNIKDLNPYQNKYTIQARVTSKSKKKEWSNSRGTGCVFDFVLKDASGDIKVTAFNDQVQKYVDLLQEGKVYYLSNAKIQPVRKPEYNNTSHNYELTILNHTTIEPCQDKNGAVPQIDYNFVKVADIQNVEDKEKIDILVLVKKVEACVNQSLRSGRETKKREIAVTDDSQTEIMMTLWGENAEKYDEKAIEGKILAVRSVMVTDWNGKSLSCTFGSSLEINPDLEEARQILNAVNPAAESSKNLTVNSHLPKIDSDIVYLKQIQTEFEESNTSHQSKYYNICAYLTDLKADKIMYKACPAEKCNKQITQINEGKFKCEKCRAEFTEFNWRYILRGAIADPTGYQWITLFDDSARKVIGKSADLMAKMREDSEIEYRRHLQAAKYRQFNFSVKTSIETWNEENRLKVSVVNAELVNHQKHIQRLKAEIQALKN